MMTIYSYAEARERLSSLLEQATHKGHIKLRGRDGRVFVIRPEEPAKRSPFDIRSIKLPITTTDILEAIRESRAHSKS